MNPSFKRYSHTVIIAPKILQDDYLSLREKEPTLEMKLYTIEEVEALFAYHYDDRALCLLLKRGYSYEESVDLLESLRFLKAKKHYAMAKLEALKPLQQELIEQGFLYLSPFPERSFEGWNVLIAGYLDGYRIAAALGELHNMAIGYDLVDEEKTSKAVFAYPDIYEELHDVYNRIAEDLLEGTPIGNIYVLGANESYDLWIHEFNKLYGFSIEEASRKRLADGACYRLFRKLFLLEGLEKALEELSENHPLEGDFAEIYKIGKGFAGIFGDPLQQVALYDAIAKSKPQTMASYTNVVRRLEGNFAPSGAHVYVVGFVMGLFPQSAAENAFYYDEGAQELHRPTSEERSAENAAECSALIRSKKVVSLTYHEKEGGDFYFPSGLAAKEGYDVQVPSPLPYEFSSSSGRYLLASLLDLEKNFLYVDPRLPLLQKANPLDDYRAFDYRYTPFKPIKEGTALSYSPTSLKLYFGCPFSYYLQRILALSDERADSSFRVRIGKIMHKVMEELYKDPAFNSESAWAKAVEEENAALPFSAKEEALLLRIKDECFAAVSFYECHDALLKNPSFHSEGAFSFTLPENPLVTLKGQFDKLVEFGEESRYYVLIDYKTGGERFNEDLLPYGLSLQLPIYAYYALEKKDLEDKELIGLFIAPLLSGGLLKKPKETLESFNSKKFKLEGVFANDIDKLHALDPEAGRSSLIAGFAYSEKDGGHFYPYTLPHLKSKADFAAFALTAKEQTLKADEGVRAGDFKIAPLYYPKAGFNACDHCAFRDVCYRDENALIHLPLGEKEEDEDDEEDASSEEKDDG